MQIETYIEITVDFKEYYYEYSMTVERDCSYGADADGNRSQVAYFAEDIRVQLILDDDGDPVDENPVLYEALEEYLCENVEEIARHYEGK